MSKQPPCAEGALSADAPHHVSRNTLTVLLGSKHGGPPGADPAQEVTWRQYMSAATPAERMDSPVATQSTSICYPPERNPYRTLMVDITHRCNMECRNCYIPNRHIPDMDADWLSAILRRLPARAHIRLVGAEPTVRTDLPDLIRRVRDAGHLPMILSNGLKLANREYVRRLKEAGLRTVYLSFNGGFDDDAYEAIDDLRCAQRKAQALDALCAERMYISLGMIIARGVNDHVLGPVYERARRERSVRELHLRSVGQIGRYMQDASLSMDDLLDIFAERTGADRAALEADRHEPTHHVINEDGLQIQFTQWPDLRSKTRGRLTPEGMIEPAFEHVMANEGGY